MFCADIIGIIFPYSLLRASQELDGKVFRMLG